MCEYQFSKVIVGLPYKGIEAKTPNCKADTIYHAPSENIRHLIHKSFL